MNYGMACRVLADFGLEEAIDPCSWHWEIEVKTGWFKHRKGLAEAEHISEVRKKLSTRDRGLLDEALIAIAHTWENANNEEIRRAASAIRNLLHGEEHVTKGFSAYDPPIEEYTRISSDILRYPNDVKFAEQNAGLLQSCREAVNYRLHNGKEDFNRYYPTRTVAIYYTDGNEYYVAFDDDPQDNILLTGDYSEKVPRVRVQNAIERAQHTGRTITITEERKDSLAVARRIIGNHAERYDRFLQKHRSRELSTWILNVRNDENLRTITPTTAVCYQVILCGHYSNVSIDAIDHYSGHARGVQRISIMNSSQTVPYIGIKLFEQLKLYRSEHDMPEVNKYFSRYEPVNKKAQNAFYTGLACAREHIETEEDLERACTAMQTLAPAMAPAQNKAELFSQTMRPPYMQIWYEHTKTAARFFNHITKSKTKTKKLIETLKRIDEKNATQLLPFFIYLLEQRHKQLLEILETHSIIYALEAGFTKELDFLTDFATPITQREYNLQRITNLTTPIAQLDERIQKIFLEKLTVQTHLGIPNDLITTLDTQTHSFIDAAYLLFFLIKDNNLEKAEQKLPKLQEEEQKLQKIIQNAPLNEQQQTQFRATLEKISFQFYDLVLDVYTQLRNKKFKDILSEKFACNVRNPAKKAANSSFHNALILLKNIKGTDEEKLLRTLIRHYLEEDTYPFKRPKHAYPFTLERNQGWLQHQKNAWLKQFTQKYTVSPEQGSNIETRIHHHIEDARGILQKLNIPELLKEKNIDLQNLTTQQIIEIYQELAKESDKYDPILLGDLKTQQLALKTLQGQQHAISRETTITIEQEFDPLETMQMGNYVHGSCLNVNGSKNWSAIVNAIDANKRVLWAKENGRIIARVLIAIDNNNKIVRFPTYYATNLSLDEEFDDYIRKLAKRCKLSLNGSRQNVSNLIANRWYSDPERNI